MALHSIDLARLNGQRYRGPLLDGRPHTNINCNEFGTSSNASGTLYTGEWCEGEQHGKGTITFADGATLVGQWNHGRLIKETACYRFEDGLKYNEQQWKYCRLPNERAFYSEREEIDPEQVRLQERETLSKVPHGAFDVGDGFIDEMAKKVYAYDSGKMIREASEAEWRWAIEKAPMGGMIRQSEKSNKKC